MISEQLREWARAERLAVNAEESLRGATNGQMQQGPEILQLRQRATELRSQADALFHAMHEGVKRFEGGR